MPHNVRLGVAPADSSDQSSNLGATARSPRHRGRAGRCARAGQGVRGHPRRRRRTVRLRRHRDGAPRGTQPFPGPVVREAAAEDTSPFVVFDEADSLFADRRFAHRSWEVCQVNEMLTWMESRPLPLPAPPTSPSAPNGWRGSSATLRRSCTPRVWPCALVRDRTSTPVCSRGCARPSPPAAWSSSDILPSRRDDEAASVCSPAACSTETVLSSWRGRIGTTSPECGVLRT